MIKYATALVLLLCCAAAAAAAETAAADTVAAPARLTGERGEYLIGPLERGAWEAFAPTLRAEATGYVPSPDVVDALADFGGDVRIVCVLGTWCSDSRREVPRLWKVLESAGLHDLPVELLAVGPASDPAAAAWEAEHGLAPGPRARWDVERVPTFVILEGDLELGRIVETPELSIEADLAAILGVNPSPSWH